MPAGTSYMRKFKIPPLVEAAAEAAAVRQARLTKPLGSLGLLEDAACRMAGIQGSATPSASNRWIVVAASDHGVTEEGVSAYPPEVTAQMVHNFLNGGAAINVLARQAGASLIVVDAGIRSPVASGSPGFRSTSAGRGTANFARAPAMSRGQAELCVSNGAEVAEELGENRAHIVALGDMGIGNTASATAITAAMTGTDPALITGRGAGLDDAGLDRKAATIRAALELHGPDPDDPLGVLSLVGGFEIGFLAGLMLGASERRIAIALDGYIVTSAALIAHALEPRSADYMFACHLSAEPGHRVGLDRLGLEPLLDLKLRLGEGSGAALGIMIIEAAVKLHNEMSTFEEAAVSGRVRGDP